GWAANSFMGLRLRGAMIQQLVRLCGKGAGQKAPTYAPVSQFMASAASSAGDKNLASQTVILCAMPFCKVWVFGLVQRLPRLLFRHFAQTYIVAILIDRLFTDALDLAQIVGAFEGAMFLSIFDDCLSASGS